METKIKGPDNPTSQFLPIMRNKSCSGTGKEGKTKEVVEDREVKQIVCEELCVIKLCVKDVSDTIMCVKDCVQWRATKRCKCFHGATDNHRSPCMAQEHTHTCIATKIKRRKCFFPRWAAAMRLLQQDRRASYDTSSWQPAAHSRGIDALPISENPACLPPMEKMEGEPGRDAKADQVQKTQCKDTTSHCFMRVLIENNTDGSAFRFPTVAYQMQWAHIDQCVRNDFEVSKPRFWDTPDKSWAPGNHTGVMGLKDRCDGKPSTTSSLARTYGTNIRLFFFAAPTSPAAHAISSHVGSRSRNWWDEVRQHLQWCIAGHHLQWRIDVWVPKEDSCARVPYAGSSR